MKLPRWLVILMLTSSVLVPLAAAGWWWVTWPERTAREYIEAMAHQRWEDVVSMRPAAKTGMPQFTLNDNSSKPIENWDQLGLEKLNRDIADILAGRQSFRFPQNDGFAFAVERGQIVIQDSNWLYLLDASVSSSAPSGQSP